MKIGRYEVVGMLGKGGMSRVYKVKCPVIEKIAALKLLSPDPLVEKLMGFRKIVDLFVSEAYTMAQLRHPNIVTVWDYDQSGNKPFYLMDYFCHNLGVMIGETYRTDIPSRVIRLDKVIYYVRQILQGLVRLHDAGIIHRDIKPYNILITEHETAKISDFGLSKLRGEKFGAPSNLKVGSPWYAAPEQEKNPDQVDFSADIYPVGIMLYRMLTGMLPPENHKELIAPSRLNPDLDEYWDHFVLKAMATHSKNRFSTASHMLKEFETLADAWEQRKDKFCTLVKSPEGQKQKKYPISLPRSTDIKVRPSKAKDFFQLDDLWKPKVFLKNDFQQKTKNSIIDRATGLIWQTSGSPYPITWHQAQNYINTLNENAFDSRSDWRLPTINELTTLLTNTPHGEDFCMEPVFDRKQKWLWSSDRRSFMAAWYVNMDLGFVAWHDFSGYYYVKAVCKKRQ